jgi:hypothetical protein
VSHQVRGRGHVVVLVDGRQRRPHDVPNGGRVTVLLPGRLLRRGLCHDLLRFRDPADP